MASEKIKNITIVGGGTAGWMTAAALSRFFPPEHYRIQLVESEQIGTVGVGEATIPHIRYFNNMLGINEQEFIQAVGATFKLGIKFDNWGALGQSYIHPFGSHGYSMGGIEFQHYWLHLAATRDVLPFDQYSLAVVAAQSGKFEFPSTSSASLLSSYDYAYHIDASLYARFLRQYAETKGVERIEAKVLDVSVDPHSGFIKSLTLDTGSHISGDLFIDCSGFRGLLISGALKVQFDDWSKWLPCDKAVAIPSEKLIEPIPYTRADAQLAGWQWRIPLQHRTGNGHVYCSQFMDDQQALDILLKNIQGEILGEPNFLRFTAGRRKKSWEKNCVAIGLSSGFLEPLESTSIYLIQLGIMKLLEFFPDLDYSKEHINEFNQQMDLEYLRIRDFLILHYHVTQRSDSVFWNYCRTMQVPDELKRKMHLFESTAHIAQYEYGLFMYPSWLAVYLGQGLIPKNYDKRVAQFANEKVSSAVQKIQYQLNSAVKTMPIATRRLSYDVAAESRVVATPSMSLYGKGVR